MLYIKFQLTVFESAFFLTSSAKLGIILLRNGIFPALSVNKGGYSPPL